MSVYASPLQSDMEKLAPTDDDTAIIAEAMYRQQLSVTADSDNRALQLDDLAFKLGDQWDPVLKRERAMDKRPCLTINKLPVFTHQVTNAQRKNVPSIIVHPVGGGADKELAQILQGAIRHIEYRSSADVCYNTAVNSATDIGIGYYYVTPQYVSPDSFDQELIIKRIRNPFTVYMDPDILEVDGSDQKWCLLASMIDRPTFKLMYPNADPCNYAAVSGLGDSSMRWVQQDQLQIAQYYRIYYESATAILLSNGETGWEDKLEYLPDNVTIVKRRASLRPIVQWFKLTANEVLERTIIKCKWIPVFPVVGEEIDIDGKLWRSGIIRNAKDPARMYNYWMTAATEEIGLRPKAPFIGAEGQFEGHLEKWQQANRRSFPFMEYKMKSLNGQLAPPPQRQPMSDVPVGVLSMAAHASDDIKATTGIYDASLGARSNETSGVAIRTRDRQGETANYHFTDNANITLRHLGRCLIDMIPSYYDGQRILRTMGTDGKVKGVEVNQPLPAAQQKIDPKTGAIQKILNDLTVGEYDVTVGVGPSYDTLRQEAVESMLQTAQSWPKLMDIAGDKVIRAMDWPQSDDIADRVEKTIPPQLRDKPDDQEQSDMVQTPRGPMPKDQVGSAMAQMQQQLQQMQQQLQDAQSGIDKERIKAQSAKEVALINADSRQDVEEIKGWIAMLMQRMIPPAALEREIAQDQVSQVAPESQQVDQMQPQGQPPQQF